MIFHRSRLRFLRRAASSLIILQLGGGELQADELSSGPRGRRQLLTVVNKNGVVVFAFAFAFRTVN